MTVLLQIVAVLGAAVLLAVLVILAYWRIERHHHLKTTPPEVGQFMGWSDFFAAVCRAYPELKQFRGRCPHCYFRDYLFTDGSLFLNHLNEVHEVSFAEAADLLESGLP